MQAAQVARDLDELTRNLWWSWSNDAVDLFERLSREIPPARRGNLLRAPRQLFDSLKPRAFGVLASDPAYRKLHARVLKAMRQASRKTSRVRGLSWKHPAAYFSMEFGLHESLPIYSGGLGILAGDHAKAASDEGVPVVGVGMLYRKGYFRQELDGAGKMKVLYPALDFEKTPACPVTNRSGRELRIPVELPDGTCLVRVWRLVVGQVEIYLLDTDFPENSRRHRTITHRLYGGDRENRIRQEIVLGIGGVRLLKALGIEPGVWHLNEGHVAFLALERLHDVRMSLKLSVSAALEAIAGDTVFTTHTPVPEGNEEFDVALVREYVAPFCAAAGISPDEFLDLGVDHTRDDPMFSMTVLALQLSRFRNGVSKLHGEVARRMWSFLWPGFRDEEAPVDSVTNGVHMTAWVAPQIEELLNRHVGSNWTRHLADEAYWRGVRRIPDKELWRVKRELKVELVDFVRRVEDRRLARLGHSQAARTKVVSNLLDPNALTIGWARRFALYKRAALFFKDAKRAARILNSTKRPVQIVFAGKPHPEDPDGKKVFEQVARLARRREFRGKVVLLENYDTEVCRYLVRGVDVWLNNPRRPLEASGTSGQKVPINGGLNLSILDGWWCEGYTPQTGWTFGKTKDYDKPELQDAEDVAALYRAIEREVLPLYYTRNKSGLPKKWISMLKGSMAALTPQFSSNRMVREYAERFYLAAFENGKRLRARGGALAKELVEWQESVATSLSLVHLRGGLVRSNGTLVIEAFLGGLDPKHLRCWGENGDEYPVKIARELTSGLYVIEIGRGASKKSRLLRLFPSHPGLVHPHELGVTIDLVAD